MICTASVQESVPRWMAGQGRGWLTAEYGMLPASTGERKQRDVTKGRPDGRTVEIQRLIGRSLRGVVDFEALGERTVYVDCDVLAGRRRHPLRVDHRRLRRARARLPRAWSTRASSSELPLTGSVAAVSCGIVDGVPLLDLDYPEDSTAEVDANVVMTGEGGLVEVQATAERTPLSRAHLDELLALAAARDRGAARGAGRPPAGRAVAMRPSCSRPATPTSCASSSACCPGVAARRRCPTSVELPPETGDTFAENALIKARAAARPPAAPAIADDSGIEAEALGGAPACAPPATPASDATDGENLAKLRARGAAPAAAPALRLRDRLRRRPAARSTLFEGRCDGHAGRRSPAASGGFGYDPVFVPDDGDGGRTMAELTDDGEGRDLPPRPRRPRALLAWLADDR